VTHLYTHHNCTGRPQNICALSAHHGPPFPAHLYAHHNCTGRPATLLRPVSTPQSAQ
jgi:hypothetical protein